MAIADKEFWKRARSSVFAGASALLVFSTAHADVVVLKNGDRISGDLLERGGEQVTVSTSYAGPISVPRSEISRIESAAPSKQVTGEKAAPVSEDVVKAGKTLIEDVALDAVEMEKKKEWSGSVNLAMKLEGGDSNEEREIDGDFQTRWERERRRFRMSGQIEYDTTGGNATKQDWMIVPRYDQFFSDKAYWSLSYSAKQEKYKSLSLRQTIGPALGYEFFSNEKNELISEIGLFYTTEDYIGSADASYAATGWHLEYRRKIWQDKFEFYHRHLLFVRADDAGQKIWHSWTGLKFPIYEGLNLSSELELDYDNITVSRSSDLEDTFRLKLGYEW